LLNLGGWVSVSNNAESQITSPLTPPGQQRNKKDYSQFDAPWLCNWLQPKNNNIDVFLLMNGDIFNHPPASKQYNWNEYSAYATPPKPPTSTSTTTGKPLPTQSYINTYNTAFNQPPNPQETLNEHSNFTPNETSSNFDPELLVIRKNILPVQVIRNLTLIIHYLQDDASVYVGTPYLFVSAGSGGGSGFMYLDWIIVTYGVPYVVSVL